MGIRIGDWDWGLGIGDWEWGLMIVIVYRDRGLGLGIEIGD